MARNGRANHAGRWTSRRSLSVPRMVLEFPNSRNQDPQASTSQTWDRFPARWVWSARGHGTIHRFGRQGGRRESLPRGLVVVRSLAGRAARAIGLALGCNGSTRLHNGACKSAGPRSSGERPSYCLGRKWTRLPRLVANEFFRGRLSDPAFQTSEANLIEFIKARGRALDREQVSNGSLTHPPATSGPGNKAATSGLPIGSHKSLCAPDHSRKRARPIGLVKTPGRRNWSPSCP